MPVNHLTPVPEPPFQAGSGTGPVLGRFFVGGGFGAGDATSASWENTMRHAGNFHPEWGYLAPAPSFARTARIAIVAAAIGATAGSAVVFSLVDRPGIEDTVAARTLAQPADSVLTVAPVAAAAGTQNAERRIPVTGADDKRSAASVARDRAQDHAPHLIPSASSESGTVSTTQRLTGATGLAEASVMTDVPPTAQPSSDAMAGNGDAMQAQKKLAGKKLPPQPAPPRGPLALLRSFGVQN
jgi:hypothetical protein